MVDQYLSSSSLFMSEMFIQSDISLCTFFVIKVGLNWGPVFLNVAGKKTIGNSSFGCSPSLPLQPGLHSENPRSLFSLFVVIQDHSTECFTGLGCFLTYICNISEWATQFCWNYIHTLLCLHPHGSDGFFKFACPVAGAREASTYLSASSVCHS